VQLWPSLLKHGSDHGMEKLWPVIQKLPDFPIQPSCHPLKKASWPGSDVPAHEVQEISAAFSHRIHHVAPSCTMFVAIGRSSRH